MKTLQEMQKEIVHIFSEYDKQGTSHWNYNIASHDMQYQIGMLTKGIMQLQNQRFRDNMSDAQIKEKIADELADILAEVLFISHDLKIDIHQAWENMTQSDKNKINTRSKN